MARQKDATVAPQKLASATQTRKIGRNDPCSCGSGVKYKKCHGSGRESNRSRRKTGTEEGNPPRRWKPYGDLVQIEAERRRAIEEIFVEEFAFIDDCLALAAKQVEALGEIPPSSIEDVAMRDLSCDAFEFLYDARRAIGENRPSVVFPVMRRAFESISLCHLFNVRPEFARNWSEGRKITHSDVRKHLDNAPMTDSADELREEYAHFSRGAHPNRTHLPYVFLGEGNKFTLGSIPPIDHLILGDHVRHLMQLCYWYVGVFASFYRESVTPRVGRSFAMELVDLTPRIKRLRGTLDRQLAELQEKRERERRPRGMGPEFLPGRGDESVHRKEKGRF